MTEKCKKSFCLKQVNPNIPDLYFGVPFQKDKNYGECCLCEMGKREREFIVTEFPQIKVNEALMVMALREKGEEI